ncbi:MAG: hypothetical protein ACP5HC_06445 [Caldisericum sp.]
MDEKTKEELVRKGQKLYYKWYKEKHRDKIREYMRKWREKNREKIREYNREYMRKYRNTDKFKAAQERFFIKKALELEQQEVQK